jgi:hypothetical protein
MSPNKTTKPAGKTSNTTKAKPTKAKAAKLKIAKPDGKLSALDAAAKVLAGAGEPMNTKAMIEAMAAKNLWTSPGGATPWATLYTVVTMLPNLAP